MDGPPKRRVSLNEAAYRRLRSEIIACRLVPGEKLTEKTLAADFGFSVAPLRDALTRLDHEGLVRTVPRRGYTVAPLTPQSIDNLFVVWRIVGPELVRLGIRQASKEQLDAARSAFDELHGLVKGELHPSPIDDIEVINGAFGILAQATGNTYLITILQRLVGDMSRIRALRLTAGDNESGAAPTEHWVRHILAEKDPDRAAADAGRYIDEVHQQVLQAVSRWPSVMSSEVNVYARD